MAVFTSKDFPTAPRYRGTYFSPDLAVPYQSTPLDSFRTQVVASDGEHNVVAFVRDVALLLDQKAINSKGLESVVNALLSNVRTSSVADQFSGLSDNELISVIKSRYIQAPCELLAWSEWLENNITELSEAAQKVLQQKQEPAEPTEPAESAE